MATVIVLGGCGAVGSVAVKTLAGSDLFSKVVIGDMNAERARALIAEMGANEVSYAPVDAEDPNSIRRAAAGADLVVNCIGPFYKTVKTVLQTVIEEKIDYVDVCDDVDVTLDIFEMDQAAKTAGITAVIGMGSSPGATNLLAKFAADHLLDETQSVDIFHAHGGEPVEGEGVIGHRFHCMQIDIPMFLDGRLQYVKFFSPEGRALRRTFDFPMLGENICVYPYPHPEQVTLPNHIPLRQVTNRGTVLPDAYYRLIKDMCRLGITGQKAIDVKGQAVVPYDFAIAFILQQRERILEETGFGQQRGCCSVVARGRKDGETVEYRFHMASKSQALGEGTGIPAALGAMLMQQGKIAGKGVLPPEGCIDPNDFIGLVTTVMAGDKSRGDKDAFQGVIVEKVDKDGNIETLDM
ncbi:MAG: saccharopine dehydrogenase family protein [Thermodesulfobacteriota bacterium]